MHHENLKPTSTFRYVKIRRYTGALFFFFYYFNLLPVPKVCVGKAKY